MKRVLISTLCGIIAFSLPGCSLSGNDISSEIPSRTELVNARPITLGLSLKDFPLGWQMVESVDKSAVFSARFTDSIKTVECSVVVFSSIVEARTQYDSDLVEYSKRYTTSKLSLGDDAYALEMIQPDPSLIIFRVVFIKNNVYTQVWEYSDTDPPLLEEVVIWARKIENRIN